jgi:hypothetical protein
MPINARRIDWLSVASYPDGCRVSLAEITKAVLGSPKDVSLDFIRVSRKFFFSGRSLQKPSEETKAIFATN